MKAIVYSCFILLFCSCANLKIATNRTTTNTTSIGIERVYDADINDLNKDSLEKVIQRVMDRFNSEKHAFNVHNKLPKEKDFLTLDFSKAKIASNGTVAIGYTVSALGLIASPILVYVLSEKSFLLFFWYFPTNKIYYSTTLSPSLADDKGATINVRIETDALFRNKRKRMEVSLRKFEKVLYESLLDIESQLKNK